MKKGSTIGSLARIITVVILSFLVSNSCFASDESHEAAAEKGFNAGETIIHHVQDAHEIHLFDGLTIPLPIIIYSEKGLDVFMSSQFHHGTVSYTSPSTGNTYDFSHEHITEASGVKVYDLSITKNVAGMLLAVIIMFWLFLSTAKGYVKNKGAAPKGIQSVMEPLILFIRDEVAKPSIGKKYERFMPFLF